MPERSRPDPRQAHGQGYDTLRGLRQGLDTGGDTAGRGDYKQYGGQGMSKNDDSLNKFIVGIMALAAIALIIASVVVAA